MNRRRFVRTLGSAALASSSLAILTACAQAPPKHSAAPRVVVVGAGFGGATLARYLRMWSRGTVEVWLVEREPAFVSCPLSNLVLGGFSDLAALRRDYDALSKRWGVIRVQDEVTTIDLARRRVRTARGSEIRYDRLALAPGTAFIDGAIPGLQADDERIPHAWKAGAQTQLLRRQLLDMPDGGVFAIHIPLAPFRCPPGPYERACVVADHLRRHRPRSKILVLDANAAIQSKPALFARAFDSYQGLIEYRPDSHLLAVDPQRRRLELEFDQIEAQVVNVIPPMRAGRVALDSELPRIDGRWIEVNWLSLEARGVPGVHVLGDAVSAAPGMPKSGHMANQHGKLAAAAILNAFDGLPPDPHPVLMNTCYSFVDRSHGIHVASVHQYDPAQARPLPVPGAGGTSTAPSIAEGEAAWSWAHNIWADMLS